MPKPWRSKRYLRAAEGQACVLCNNGVPDETVVAAHLPMMGAAPAGHSTKCSDIISAHLCREHHAYVDGAGRTDWETRHRALLRTLIRNVDAGLLTLSGE